MRRRDFLVGAGAAGLAVGLGGARATGPARKPPRRLLAVFVTGGWDTSYAIDPKDAANVDVPAGTVAHHAGLDVLVDPSRPGVTRFFEQFAASTAIVRGIATDAIFHNECQRRMACGKRQEAQPDLAAMVAHDVGNDLPIPYLILGDVAFTGAYAASAARLGTTNQIVELLGDPARPIDTPDDDLLRRYAEASAARARATRGALGYNRRRVDDFADALTRSAKLRALRSQLGSRGETLSLDAQIPLALDALEHDLSQAVMISTRLYWDTHGDNAAQGAMHDQTFASLCPLVAGMLARPGRTGGSKMIDDTVLLVFSEMSRTPRLNGANPPGKDHWPLTSALVVGGPIRGGQVFGLTSPEVRGVPIDLATGRADPGGTQPMYSHFIAGILRACGVDPATHFPDIQPFDAFVA